MANSRQLVYEFEDFRVEVQERLLRSQGQAMAITPKAFDTLVLLLENAGRLVEKDTFFAKLWPDTVVEEASLAQNISLLRKLLSAGTDGTRFIETVPKRGYRFVATVRRIEAGETGSAAAVQTESAVPAVVAAEAPKNRSRRVVLAAIALAALIAAVAGMLAYNGHQRPATGAIRSIAVLPLENLSGDPSQEYFSQGLTDELITALAQMHNVRVISRTSVMQYAGVHKPMRQIAGELGVDAVVEGSVARSADRVRVRAQLIRAASDEHIWAEAYERDARDLLALQADLAHDIARQIGALMPPGPRGGLTAARTIDPQAHELYLKGRYFFGKREAEGYREAADYFQQAIAIDSNYAAAYAGLADAYIFFVGFMPASEVMPKARAAAEKAVQLDDSLADAHASLGLMAPYLDFNWEESRRQYERALQLNPNYATAHHWYGDGYLAPMGRLDEALSEIRKAEALDPLSPIIATDIGKDLYFARRYDDAIAALQKALVLDRNFTEAHSWLENAYAAKVMHAEAFADFETIRSSLDPASVAATLAYLHARAGHPKEARHWLARLKQYARGQYISPGAFAIIHAALGDKDEAFRWMDEVCAQKTPHMTSLKIWEVYDPLRSDPRFGELVRRVGLEQ